MEYTWKVIAVNPAAKTFVVEYSTTAGISIKLNLLLPIDVSDEIAINKVIEDNVPKNLWDAVVINIPVASEDINKIYLMTNTSSYIIISRTPAEIFNSLVTINTNAIQRVLDSKALERGYIDIKSACAYASSIPVVAADDPHFAACEKFRLEGNALQTWMAVTWATAYAYLSTVTAGTNQMPTSAEAVAMMPLFTWPA